MSFGGHVNDMINRVKQNAALKNARRKKFKGGNDYSKTKNIKTAYNFSEFSEKELTEFKQKLKKETNEKQQKKLLFWAGVTLIMLIAFLIFNYY